MSAPYITVPEAPAAWNLPSRGRVAMYCLIAAESAIFTIFVIAYLFYIGKSATGPQPKQVLQVPIFFSICLLSSSWTIHAAIRALRRGRIRVFREWWTLTFVLGGIFLTGTAHEWYRLIYHEGLTISTNLFGTTYYSLVGLHAFHVTVGLIALLTVLLFTVAGHVNEDYSERIDVLALYWHFV